MGFRNVFENYPAARLPSDLREGFYDAAVMTVTIEPEGGLQSGQMITGRRFLFRDGRTVLVDERELQCP